MMKMHHRQLEIQCLILNKLTRGLWLYKKKFLHYVNDVLEILNNQTPATEKHKETEKAQRYVNENKLAQA